MDQDNQYTERFSTHEKLSLGGKLESNGKLSITGCQSLTEKVSFGRTSATDLTSLGRQSLINNNLQGVSASTRGKTALLQKEIEENSKCLKNFILNQTVFPVDPIFEKKKFNYATETNFLDYLQIVVWHIDKDYKCTKLQEDLNFFLNVFDLESLQETIFKNITNNWKYIVDGFVKLIRIIESHNDTFQIDNYNEENYANYFNGLTIHDILIKTIQNMGISDDCKTEHYEDVLKCYMENCDNIYLTDTKSLDNLKTKVEFLRRKKKEHEDVYKEFECESYKLISINKEVENLNNILILNDKQLINIREELNKKMFYIENKNDEIINVNEEWIITKEKIHSQKLSKGETLELCESTAITSNRIDVVEKEIKQLKKSYCEKYDEISELLKTVDTKSRSFIEQLVKVNRNIDGNIMIENIDHRYLDISGNLNQNIDYYKSNISCMLENFIKEANKILILKENVLKSLKIDIKNMINDCETLTKIHTDLRYNYYAT